MRVLVTGANGFVGGAVVERLALDSDVHVRGVVRRRGTVAPPRVELARIGDLAVDTDWRHVLAKSDVVIHTAARVHIMHDPAANPLAEFRAVNVAGTLRLARQAAGADVKRFIFLSSIKVNGEQTAPDDPFTADDAPAPCDSYGISKLEAEQGLRLIAGETGLEVVVIRPVLVYGPGVKANFRAMMRSIQKGVPLPLGAIHNRRSLVALDNLVDLIDRSLAHPAAANQTFLVSDGEDLSTTALFRRTAAAMGKRACLIPVPRSLLEMSAKLLGKGGEARRLCSSLTVDIARTRELLDWTPPVSVDRALQKTVAHFLKNDMR